MRITDVRSSAVCVLAVESDAITLCDAPDHAEMSALLSPSSRLAGKHGVMTEPDPRAAYRQAIDALVDECHNGQGSVLPEWVERGVWPIDRSIASALGRFTAEERHLVAKMLRTAYSGAVHDTLRVLEDHEFPALDQAYEGSPFQDFMGRLESHYDWPST